MQKKQLQKLGERLTREKDELLKVEAGLVERGLGMPMKDAFTELSAYDNHPGDSGSQLYERSKDFGLLQVTSEQIGEIEEALNAMEEGNYGICRGCGRPISRGRLLALPRTLFCTRCKREVEDRDLSSRPVEEELLYPPFGRTFTDETDSIIFDGEDSWEAVERYGTSSDEGTD